MTLADKIVVLRDGVVEQVGTPLELYDDPDNLFVAGFIGSPEDEFPRRRHGRGRGAPDLDHGDVAVPVSVKAALGHQGDRRHPPGNLQAGRQRRARSSRSNWSSIWAARPTPMPASAAAT